MEFAPHHEDASGLAQFTIDQVAAHVAKLSPASRALQPFLNKPQNPDAIEQKLSCFSLTDCYKYVQRNYVSTTFVSGSKLVQCALGVCSSVELTEMVLPPLSNVPPSSNTSVVTTTITTTTTTTTTVSTSSTASVTTTTTTTVSPASKTAPDTEAKLVVKKETAIAEIPLISGFPVVSCNLVPILAAVSIPALPSPSGLIKMAIAITHLVFIRDGHWSAKNFVKPIIRSSDVYKTAAVELEMLLHSTITLQKDVRPSMRGMELVDFLVQSFVGLMSKDRNRFFAFKAKLDNIMPATTEYGTISELGEFTAKGNPYEYTMRVLELCRAIRGEDKSDNTPLGSAYYIGAAVPRVIVKALAFTKDCFQLLRYFEGASGIFFSGGKAGKRIYQLALVGVHTFKFGAHCLPPVGYVAPPGSTQYRRSGSQAVFVQEPDKTMILVYFDVPPKPNCSWYEVYETTITPSNYNRTIPSCLIHNMRGFQLKTPWKQAINFNSWLSYVRLINVNRTFGLHAPSFSQLVTRFPQLEPFKIKVSALGLLSRNLTVTFDASILDGTTIALYRFGELDEFEVPPSDDDAGVTKPVRTSLMKRRIPLP